MRLVFLRGPGLCSLKELRQPRRVRSGAETAGTCFSHLEAVVQDQGPCEASSWRVEASPRCVLMWRGERVSLWGGVSSHKGTNPTTKAPAHDLITSQRPPPDTFRSGARAQPVDLGPTAALARQLHAYSEQILSSWTL